MPDWNIKTRPFVFNQEGPSLWCGQILRSNYSHCLNTGTTLWMRSEKSTKVMREWWRSADDPYDDINNPLGYKFRTQPYWEQIKAEYLLQSSFSKYIQVASHPENKLQLEGPCLSDCWLPPNFDKLGCFILHYCMKDGLVETYGNHIKEYVKQNKISKGEICSPRAVLPKSSSHYSAATMFDTTPCRPEWIGNGEQEVVN